MLRKSVFALILVGLLASWAIAKDEEQVYILYKPEPNEDEIRSICANENWGFEFDLRDGFSYTEEIDEEDGVFNLTIQLKGHPLQAAMTIEQLDEEMSSNSYWKQMQEKDPSIENLLVYEKGMDIDNFPGVRVRLEGMDQNSHFVVLSLIFSSGDRGYSISVFCDAFYFEEVPDFFEEITEGFAFYEDAESETGDEDTETEDE